MLTRRYLLAGTGAAALGGVLMAQAARRGGVSDGRPQAGLTTRTPATRIELDRGQAVHVRDFGAVGDGVADDTAALAAAARRIEAMGGGTLLLGSGTYLIGRQRPSRTDAWSFAPDPVIYIRGCRRPVAVIGEGAVLRCAPGLRFGTFDRQSGRATRNALPFVGAAQVASPYEAAIWLESNRAGVTVAGVEIDGRIDAATLGGGWGDTGWQIAHYGIKLYHNAGLHLVSDVRVLRHGLDGLVLMVDPPAKTGRASPVRIERFTADRNGRQGISIIGGTDIDIVDSVLTRTGRNGRVSSAPGAGLDLEAELAPIRRVRLHNCELSDNNGAGIVADSGDTADVTLSRCLIVGRHNVAAWPNKPSFRFEACEIRGAVVRCFEAPDDLPRATRFTDCLFDDRRVPGVAGGYYGERCDLGGSGNGTLFDRCSFDYSNEMQLPWTGSRVRYRDCRMTQTSAKPSYPRGTYFGASTINGNAQMEGSRIVGTLRLNGRPFTG